LLKIDGLSTAAADRGAAGLDAASPMRGEAFR
jgi:hypothetical protein